MSENIFVKNRKNVVAEKRIKIILWYVIECYLLASTNNEKYSKAWVKNNTSIKFENYLRNRLVDDYLIANKDLLKQKTLSLSEINFIYEPEKEYIDARDGKIKSDKIDIYINKLGLQKEWAKEDENLYFAIECKRIKVLSDTKEYITDIENFCLRRHKNTRLPFEGQIAFIENKEISHQKLQEKINEILLKHKKIVTSNFLKSIVLNEKFEGAYLSKHLRGNNKQNFSVYHLLLDYSDIVLN